MLPPDVAAPFDREVLISLSPWAVAGRYPEDIASPTHEWTFSIVGAARRVVEVATRLVDESS